MVLIFTVLLLLDPAYTDKCCGDEVDLSFSIAAENSQRIELGVTGHPTMESVLQRSLIQ